MNRHTVAVRLAVLITSSVLTVVLAQTTAAKTPVDGRLENAIQPLVRAHAGDVAVAIRNLKTGEHYAFNENVVMPTASLIKLPLMVTAYRMIDAGKLDPSQHVELRSEDKVPGSGVLTEHFSAGISLPFSDYIRLMIRYSDNTATNIVADQVGLASTAKTMEALGLAETKLHSKVYRGDTTVYPERSKKYGLGSATASEMVRLLTKLHRGELASATSTMAMKAHLLSCEDTTKIARTFTKQIEFAHKTGEIANCRTDAGVVYTSGGPVAVCFMTNKNEDQTFAEDNAAHLLAGRIGDIIIERFGQPEGDAVLRLGAFGRIVEALQRTLNDRLEPSPELSIDGDFGPATQAAVERFQRTQKIQITGDVTKETWQALGTLIEQDDPVPDPEIVNAAELAVAPQPPVEGPPFVTAKAWAFIEQGTGKLLVGENENTALEAASTTKIMTAFLVIRHATKHPDVLHEKITFSKRADNTVGSTSAIRAGEQLSVRELLYGLLLPSGNDAAVALAEHFGHRLASDPKASAGNDDAYDQFIDAMNSASKDLGLTSANYTNPHGLSNTRHVISAADLGRLSRAAMQLPLFREISRTRQFGCVATSEQGYRRNVMWENTNKLLGVEGYTGIKTGTTSAAGACLATSEKRGDDELILVVLGSSSSAARYADTQNLFRWIWQQRNRPH